MKRTTAYPGPITLETLDELFAHHRSNFGGWSMGPADDSEGDDDGEGEGDEDAGDAGTEGEGDGDEGAADLGDKGKQALDRMKTQRNTLRDQLKEFKALGLSPAQIKAMQKPGKASEGDDQPTADEIREQVRAEERAAGLKERISDKIEVKAAKLFADADDAVAILLRSHDPDDFLDGDKIDAEAIQDALDELLEKKPHLAAAQRDGKRFQGNPDGGTRKAARPGQLTRDDLKRMSPQEISKARTEGQLADLLSGKK